ncbi:microcin C ABC transporter permease YejB [Dongia sp.]|uniref:microcin C ABC transporter permease YejB n=1 Tax=Dongia sp. TaxID=1977262 RepID=UPI0035AFD0F3
MIAYIIRRLLLMIPTLFGIMIINFVVIQAAPGGPVEQTIAKLKGTAIDATARITGGGGSETSTGTQGPSATPGEGSQYRGARGLDPKFIAEIQRMYGFDKPMHERFLMMMKSYLTFDFGNSYFKGRPVVDLVVEKLPVSISIGLWAALISYAVSIPLGVSKALRDGTPFDFWTSAVIIAGSAIPGYLFAILLVVLFAGGTYWSFFPLRGLVSDNWDQLSLFGKVVDYFWHMALPIIAMVIGGFSSLTFLAKNSFIDQIHLQYVTTARAKGLTETRVLYGHVFRNAMLIVIAGFPSAIISILFAEALLIEIIFSLDGLGLLGYEAAINRDYPIMFATLYIFTLIGLVMGLIGDIMYMLVDPRIDFEARDL